jgi:hypothetical protein
MEALLKAADVLPQHGQDGGRVFGDVEHTIIIGRGADATIQLSGKRVSKSHVAITFHRMTRTFQLNCLGRNGCFVNGQYVDCHTPPTILAAGDKIEVDGIMFTFVAPQLPDLLPTLPVAAPLTAFNSPYPTPQSRKRRHTRRSSDPVRDVFAGFLGLPTIESSPLSSPNRSRPTSPTPPQTTPRSKRLRSNVHTE